ncbi:GtcA protein [Fructilactobacillus lindneri]|uniref:GtrA/DPMS transmembrane domain-containing protein n=2 Tax=Fructilactobacillus lindneri TaxID=53444 RepID=A0A0R2JRQ0_9LACO|nr:GtrA family protein [Fructilactobacillus lindneri]ANZ57973.1 GtcA protein [Fructilactobacillus lindneri]ANZ59243.1 GtcA protein [Fructilactobacillus lindneri]KRN78550.1 hypothetical protein IV52_GL000826 [Fructilactobacillus lindneri DSM 20690 = JCM 11027]POG98294.1 GtcA protein [Fructilactobacillus lindneri]POH01589.1 GtcA protein [Fructilactobacillus lindneri]
MQAILKLYQKHKDVIPYLFWGVAATAFNIIVFFLLQKFTPLGYLLNYLIDWFFTVLFAFFTNKYFVFHAEHHTNKKFWYQMATFFAGRFVTCIIGAGIMFLGISLLKFNSNLEQNVINILQNIVVIILNYFWAILISFKDKAK